MKPTTRVLGWVLRRRAVAWTWWRNHLLLPVYLRRVYGQKAVAEWARRDQAS